MNIIPASLPEVFIIEPRIFEDSRGYFFESWNREAFEKAGLYYEFVQDNESLSTYGTIRGLHFQKGEHAQAKLVRVLEGVVLDVAVDLRKDSPTYGKHVAVELSAENKRQLLIPRGFAHGFSVLSETAVFAYKCDNQYCKESEGGIRYDDPQLAIDWKVEKGKELLSEKDRTLPLFAEFESCF